MRFSVDAHAIGQHLTGNEVYVRNLLNGFAALDEVSEFTVYLAVEEAAKKWTLRHREWAMIYSQLMIYFGDRLGESA